ncbi:hypothetical protein J2Z42_000787 [Clostridium algifaecis]|uniref:Uncharacterized protein n=1 Tax=Clostridium algifaecis TaxID=1472040 RepID=A0ABS4KQ10_9CLOT|nr:hypothetical protein [Clostridium algifaecis]MBP2032122.1 hypothetical protein [Clostridium algifaecis]
MFDSLKNIFSLSDKNNNKIDSNKNTNTYDYKNVKASHILQNNKIAIKRIFDNFSDLVIREVKITNNPEFSRSLALKKFLGR